MKRGMTGMQCNVEFGYELSICSRTEENLARQKTFNNSVRISNKTSFHHEVQLVNAV
jgi:hypothetical protein